MQESFMPGLRLCELFYVEAVRPLLAEAYPDLRYAAGRVGAGSDVLGFDTERSVDHDWGPRLELFLAADDVVRYGERISELLSARLPKQFRGWSTHFEPPQGRVRSMAPTDGPVAHRVLVTDAGTWCDEYLGFDPRQGITVLDWLATPGQRLAEVTGGAVFHDSIGELSGLRERLRWYPEDVWRYLLACQWLRIGEEEAFVGRTAEAGDELGSRVVTARLVRELMRLCLLLAQRFPPYSKWLGTAFAALPDAAGIAAALDAAMTADTGADADADADTGTDTDADAARREAALCTAYEAVGEWQNRLGLAEPVDATVRPFFDRPYRVIGAGRFVAALLARIEDPDIAALPPVGAIDQYVDSTAVLCQPSLTRALMTTVWQGHHERRECVG